MWDRYFKKSGGLSCKFEGSQLTEKWVFLEFVAEGAKFLPSCYSHWPHPSPLHSLVPICAALKFANLEERCHWVRGKPLPSFTFMTSRLNISVSLPTKPLSNFTFSDSCNKKQKYKVLNVYIYV